MPLTVAGHARGHVHQLCQQRGHDAEPEADGAVGFGVARPTRGARGGAALVVVAVERVSSPPDWTTATVNALQYVLKLHPEA